MVLCTVVRSQNKPNSYEKCLYPQVNLTAVIAIPWLVLFSGVKRFAEGGKANHGINSISGTKSGIVTAVDVLLYY